jgi:hypothetical protein
MGLMRSAVFEAVPAALIPMCKCGGRVCGCGSNCRSELCSFMIKLLLTLNVVPVELSGSAYAQSYWQRTGNWIAQKKQENSGGQVAMTPLKSSGKNEENQEQPSLVPSQALWPSGRYTFNHSFIVFRQNTGPTPDPEAFILTTACSPLTIVNLCNRRSTVINEQTCFSFELRWPFIRRRCDQQFSKYYNLHYYTKFQI